MYEVVEELKSVEAVYFFDENRKLIKEVAFKGVKYYPLGEPNEISELTGESGYPYYNNIVLVCELGEVIIFQSYGDGEFITPDGYEEVNKSLIVSNNNSSLGYHDGWFVSVDKFVNHLSIQRLFKAPLPDLSSLNWKRPYSFCVLNKDKDIYYWVHLSFGRDAEPSKFLVKAQFSYDEVFSPSNINSVLILYPVRYDADYDLRHYITRDLLVYRGFCFRDGYWEKDGILIKDNRGYYPVDRCFYYNDEEIYLTKELDEIMRMEKN